MSGFYFEVEFCSPFKGVCSFCYHALIVPRCVLLHFSSSYFVFVFLSLAKSFCCSIDQVFFSLLFWINSTCIHDVELKSVRLCKVRVSVRIEFSFLSQVQVNDWHTSRCPREEILNRHPHRGSKTPPSYLQKQLLGFFCRSCSVPTMSWTKAWFCGKPLELRKDDFKHVEVELFTWNHGLHAQAMC